MAVKQKYINDKMQKVCTELRTIMMNHCLGMSQVQSNDREEWWMQSHGLSEQQLQGSVKLLNCY